MFGTSIHWTTFFYLLIDSFILINAFAQSRRSKHNNLNTYLLLALLFVLYNLTGGFLPFDGFPGPFILQYVITYVVAMTMGVYLFYYIYKEYDIKCPSDNLQYLVVWDTLFYWAVPPPLLFHPLCEVCDFAAIIR